jgi:hypothetical protein
MEPLQNPSLSSTSFFDELLSLEQLQFSLASRPSLLYYTSKSLQHLDAKYSEDLLQNGCYK